MQQLRNLQELEIAVNLNGKVIVTKNSKNNVVYMSIEEYRKNLEDEELEQKLLKAEEQIEQGKTVKATEVFEELEEKYGF